MLKASKNKKTNPKDVPAKAYPALVLRHQLIAKTMNMRALHDHGFHPLDIILFGNQAGFSEVFKNIKEQVEPKEAGETINVIVIESNLGKAGDEEANEEVLSYLAKKYPGAFFCIKGNTPTSLGAAQTHLKKLIPENQIFVCPDIKGIQFKESLTEINGALSASEMHVPEQSGQNTP